MVDENKDRDDLANLLNSFGDLPDTLEKSQKDDFPQEEQKLEEAPEPIQDAFKERCERLIKRGYDLVYEPKFLFQSDCSYDGTERAYFQPKPRENDGYMFRPRESIKIDEEAGELKMLRLDSSVNSGAGSLDIDSIIRGVTLGFEFRAPKNVIDFSLSYSKSGHNIVGMLIGTYEKGLFLPDREFKIDYLPSFGTFLQHGIQVVFEKYYRTNPTSFSAGIYYNDKFWGRVTGPAEQDVNKFKKGLIDPKIIENMRDISPEAIARDLKWRRELDFRKLTGINWDPATSSS